MGVDGFGLDRGRDNRGHVCALCGLATVAVRGERWILGGMQEETCFTMVAVVV